MWSVWIFKKVFVTTLIQFIIKGSEGNQLTGGPQCVYEEVYTDYTVTGCLPVGASSTFYYTELECITAACALSNFNTAMIFLAGTGLNCYLLECGSGATYTASFYNIWQKVSAGTTTQSPPTSISPTTQALTTTDGYSTAMPTTTDVLATTAEPLTTSPATTITAAITATSDVENTSCSIPGNMSTVEVSSVTHAQNADIIITLRCIHGYMRVSGDLQMTCHVNGTLSGEFLLCQAYSSCEEPPVIANANWTMSDSHTAVYTCNDGYTAASGSSDINCTADIWSHHNLVCLSSHISEPSTSALVGMTSLTANSNPTLAAIGLLESDTEPANVAIGSIIGLTFISLVLGLLVIADLVSIKIHFRRLRRNYCWMKRQIKVYLQQKKALMRTSQSEQLVMADNSWVPIDIT